MSVNLAIAINPKKTKHLGKYFHTIDFEVFSTSKKYLESQKDMSVVGEFIFNGRRTRITLGHLNSIIAEGNFETLNIAETLTERELDRIHETFVSARTVFWQKYKIGV